MLLKLPFQLSASTDYPPVTSGSVPTQVAMASSSDFRQMGTALSTELVETLCTEHDREVQALYQEELELRSELQRILELLTNEILPRERQMHIMIEKMQEAYEKATQHMHAEMSKMAGGSLSAEQDAQRQGLLDPLAEMEAEVARIKAALSHEVVQPDIDGWVQPTATPARTPARTLAGSAALESITLKSPARTPAGSAIVGSPARTPARSVGLMV